MATKSNRMAQGVTLALPLLLLACSSGGRRDNEAANTVSAPAAAASASPVPATTPTPTPTPTATPVARVEKSDLLDFSYRYPAAAAATPGVAALLAKRADDAKAKALADAEGDSKTAKQSGYPFHAHEYHAAWTVTADTPRFLILVGEIGDYTGGAHGMTVYQPLLWDRSAGKAIVVADLFASSAAADAALRARFCDALDGERTKKRGAPVKRSEEMFSDCIDPLKETIVPTASGQGAIDGVTVYVAPYDAGPFAEGTYEVPLTVDAKLMAAIKPEYRDAFAVGR